MTKSAQRIAWEKYLNSAAWREKRQLVLERDGHRCMMCGANGEGVSLSVHHNTYEQLGNEPLNHLVSLCSLCHPLADQRQKTQREYLGLTNQVRVNPAAFITAIESTDTKRKGLNYNGVPETKSSIDRDHGAFATQRANGRPAKSFLEGFESDFLEAV
jgi:hypothetical protein